MLRVKKKHLYCIVVILVIIVILLLLRCCNGGESIGIMDDDVPLADAFDLAIDENASERSDVSQEEIVDELNRKVTDGVITISMNLAPVFSDGSAEGNLLIVNENSNNYPQVVQIFENSTGRKLYESGLIPIGQAVEQARLDERLSAGTYPCTACFYNVDPESGQSLGMAAASIKIVVLH